MTYNKNFKTFNDIAHLLESEAKHLETAKLSDHIYIAESSLNKVLSFKRKRGHKNNQKGKRFDLDQKKLNVQKHPRGKRCQKNDKFKMRCYNCNKLDHFTRECTELKKVRPNSTLLNYALVTSSILLIESCPVWTVNSRATDHIARDRDAFIEYRQIS